MELFNGYDTLLESFSGKPSAMLKMEKLMDTVIKEVKGQRILSKDRLRVINEMKEAKEIEKGIQKIFRFKRFLLNFYESREFVPLSSPNAFTIPSSARFLSAEEVRNMGIGRSNLAKNEMSIVNVQVGTEIIRMFDLDAEETMAIILHEIGHDMDMTEMAYLNSALMFIFNAMAGNVLGTVYSVLDYGNRELTTNIAGTLRTIGDAIRKFFPGLDRFLMALSRIKIETLMATKIVVGSVGAALINPITTLPAHIVFVTGNPFMWTGYSMEKFADSYATKYGYGPALARALHKIDKNPNLFLPKVVENTPIIGKPMVDLALLNYSIVGAMMDPHPQLITRVTTQLRFMEKDLQDPNLDPRLRKELEANVAEMKKIIEKEITNPEADPKRRMVFRATYAKVMYELTGGRTDIRDIYEALYSHNRA